MKTILVTAVGGNLGQAVCSLARQLYPNFLILGTDSISAFQGYGLCNKLFNVPFASDNKYINRIKSIVQTENVDLIVPCNDRELLSLTSCPELPGITLASPFRTIQTLSDKYDCFNFFMKSGLPFCRSFLPSGFNGDFKNLIIKPRRGSGSKNIYINPSSLFPFDDTYIVQELIEGIELTIGFYVDSKNQLKDFITLHKIGLAPNNSYVVNNEFNSQIDQLLNQLINEIRIFGPCNLQCIANKDGLHPFEINCRFSGSVDIQEMLGFKIFQNSINEFLLKLPVSNSKICKTGFGIRQFKSTVYLDIPFEKIVMN